MAKVSDLLHQLVPSRGIRCEIDLVKCELLIQPEAGAARSIALPAANRSQTPQLQNWGAGICELNPTSGRFERMLPWEPDLRYGLRLGEKGPFLLRPDHDFQHSLIQAQQLIYPGFYTLRPAQGPFDLFCSQDQHLLAVVNRSEAAVLVIEPASGREVARHTFQTLVGPKLVSVALDSDRRQVWVCGPSDKRLWRWDLVSGAVEMVTGNWAAPAAVVLQDGTLWLLDSGSQQTFVHALALPDLKPVQRLSVDGTSYAQQTDTPGDLLMLDPGGKWLAVLTQVNLPGPLTPKVSVVHLADRSEDKEFQPCSRVWPVMLTTMVPNRALRSLQARHSLNRELEEGSPSGYVRALLDAQRLSLAHFESTLVVLDAEVGPQIELSLPLRELVYERVKQALAAAHGVKLSRLAQNPLEFEVQIQAARVTQLFKQQQRVDFALLRLLGEHSLELSLDRQELLEVLAAREADQFDEIVAPAPAGPVCSWVAGSGLPDGWTGLADPLNSRIFQLNPKLEVVWSLDSTSFGNYRPLDVSWLPGQGFLALDGERGRLSAWNLLGREEWAIDAQDGLWNRALYYEMGSNAGLILLDGQQGRLRRAELPGGELHELPGLEPGLPLDICPGPDDSFWLLQQQGRFMRIGLDGSVRESGQVDGRPVKLALSPDCSRLALYDGQIQKLWIWREGKLQSHTLSSPSGRYRVSEPLGLQWRTRSELVIHDAFRLLVVAADNGALLHSCLIQELKLAAGQHNLAPETIFAAQAERSLGLMGGSQASLMGILRRVPLFKDVSRDFLRELIGRLRTRIFNRGDQIVRKGDSGEEMYLIRQGTVEVLDGKNQQVVTKMASGDVFGEVALMLSLPRNATVRAGGYCELFILRQADLDALLPDYPEVKERLLQLARDRQQQEQLRSEADQEQLRTRIQVLMAQKRRALPVTKAAAPRVESESGLPPLSFWAVHPQSGQIARVNRAGEAQQLLGPLQGLVQPVAALDTPNGTWVLDMGLNALLLLDGERTRLSLERWNSVFLAQPRGMAETPDGSLWVANTGCSELLLISRGGELLRALPCGRAPAAVSLLANGHLLVTDLRQHTVSEITTEGEEVWRYGTPRAFGRDENLLFAPESAQRLDNGHTLIADTGNSRILEVDEKLRIVWSVTSATGLRVIRPTQAKRLDSGNTLIEHSNHFYWLEITPEQLPVWRYTLPVRGFFFAEAVS